MSKPPATGRMASDIELVVAHSAPAALRARRGDDVAMARLPLATPVKVRHVPPEAFRDLRLRESAEEQIVAKVFEDRIWRRAAPGTALPEVLVALAADDPTGTVRLALDDLWLDPFVVKPSEGVVHSPLPVVSDAERPRMVLDLSAEAAAGMAARFARNVAHDGAGLWIAQPIPLLGGNLEERELVLKRIAESPEYYRRNGGIAHPRYPNPRAHPSAVDGYVGFLSKQRRYTFDAKALRAGAATLAKSIAPLADEPMADLARFVRLQSVQLMDVSGTVRRYCAKERPDFAGEGLDRLKAHLDRLRPIAALASCDLVPNRDIPASIDVMYAAAAYMRENAPHTGSYAIGALDVALAYVEHVARPRLAATPLNEADAESLSGLRL